MKKTIVVSQPMFLPWYGLFEQVKLSNVFVHYDDIQLPQGRSFSNRVQLKTASGIVWLTAPIESSSRGLIKDTKFSENTHWRKKHLSSFAQAFAKCPHKDIALGLLDKIYSTQTAFLSEFNIFTLETIATFLGLTAEFCTSSDKFPSELHSTDRLVEITSKLKGTLYVTGHGAKNYLEYEKFEQKMIDVHFIKYDCTPYNQLFGDFTPYVTILDLIANTGEDAQKYLTSQSVDRRSFLNG